LFSCFGLVVAVVVVAPVVAVVVVDGHSLNNYRQRRP